MSLNSRISRRLRREFIKTFKVKKYSMNATKIISLRESQDAILELIHLKSPFLVARFGTTESRVLLDNKKGRIEKDSINNLWKLSGVFPPTPETATRFARELQQVSKQIDVCAVRAAWYEQLFWKQDEEALEYLKIHPTLMDLEGLSPLNVSNPWVSALKGLNVLIIHPFANSIKSQYLRRQLLFNDPNWLPEFNLVVLESVQSLSGTPESVGFSDWFEALNNMKSSISKLNFDIALVGAGAYGIFLGAHIKSVGKQAIHIGGALQLFFGIKGSRWTDPQSPEFIPDSARSSWVWPSTGETPETYKEVENGAYWESGGTQK